MIILSREQFVIPRVGCCGLTRNDMIYPIGDFIEEEEFIKDAFSVVESYNKGTDMRVADTYSLEYFLGEPGQNFRENGRTLYLLELTSDGRWHYSKDSIEQFSVCNLEELREKWESYLI